MSSNLAHQLNLLIDAAHESSRFMIRDFGEIVQLQNSKRGVEDFVTKCQMRITGRLNDYLLEKRPKYKIINSTDKFPDDVDYFFVIEPIIGLENFKHSIAFCCSAIALYQQNVEEALAIIIHNPILRESFYAAKGLGAWFESYSENVGPKSRMRVSTKTSMDQAFKRDLGNPLLELAYLAAGRLDLVTSTTNNALTRAAFIMLREAGGSAKITDNGFIASNDALIKLL